MAEQSQTRKAPRRALPPMTLKLSRAEADALLRDFPAPGWRPGPSKALIAAHMKLRSAIHDAKDATK